MRKLGTELSPTVLAGLRACFVNPAAIPSIIARRFGVSPAALTRAQAKLHELARVELRECSPEMAECLLNAMYEAFSNA